VLENEKGKALGSGHFYKNLEQRLLFSVSWGGVRLSPLGTSAINWSIIPAADVRSRWNENCQGKPKYSVHQPSYRRYTYNVANEGAVK
jgi:hypothetical protein